MASFDSKAEFQATFAAQFAELISSGTPKQEAAAQALLKTKQLLASKQQLSVFAAPSSSSSSSSSSSKQMDDEVAATVILQPVAEYEMFREKIQLGATSGDYLSAIRFIGEIFSSHEKLTKSFCDLRTPEDNSSVDMKKDGDISIKVTSEFDNAFAIGIDGLTETYKMIVESERSDLLGALTNAFEQLTASMSLVAPSCSDHRSLKPFIATLESPILNDPSNQAILTNFLTGVDKLPSQSKRLLCDWIQSHAGEIRFRKYIALLRQFMTLAIYAGSVDHARYAARALAILYTALPQVKSKFMYHQSNIAYYIILSSDCYVLLT